MYSNIGIVPKLPGNLVEFSSADGPGSMHHVLQPPVQRDMQSINIRQFLDNLAGLDFEDHDLFDIWEYGPFGDLVGFGQSGRRILRTIAHYLRTLHLSSMYCSDILRRVHIEVNSMTVFFPYEPVNDNHILQGIRKDTEDFRYFVGQLIRRTNQFFPLPADLAFFFSGIFNTGLRSADLNVVKQHSFLQLFHPATFNNADRFDFIHAIVAYRNERVYAFETGLQLHPSVYGLYKWKSQFNNDYTLSRVMKRCLFKHALPTTEHCASIPWFVRSVHHHFAGHEKARAKRDRNYQQRSHGEIFEIVHRELPGVYSKILDAVLRKFGSVIAETLENEAYGFKSDQIRM